MDFTKTILKGVRGWTNENFVSRNAQTLTEEQKAQIRENIDAEKKFVDPTGAYQELVTDANGARAWTERTHYEYFTEVIPETSYSMEDAVEGVEGIPIKTPLKLIEGNDYIVVYNGSDYPVTAQKLTNAEVVLYFLGNIGAITGEESDDNGLPFLFAVQEDEDLLAGMPEGVYGLFLPLDQLGLDESQIKGTYSIKGSVTKKLNSKFYDTPDWNAQEGEEGYIKNKTHGINEYIEYFPETELQLENLDGFFAATMTVPESMISWIEIDKVYTITYNGVNYNCKYTLDSNLGAVYIGNASAIGKPASDEPFLMIGQMAGSGTVNITIAAFDQTAATTITLKISNDETRIQKLDKKYLPDNIFYMEGEGPTMIMEQLNSEGSGTFTASAPLEENKKYIVTISGEEFNVKCHKLSQNENLYLYLGNASLAFEATDTKEDFLFFTSSNDPTNFNYIFRNFPYNSEFFIKSAGSYSKIPSQHLPQPNWNANKGEEGYIENRTHYHIPGFTAHWDGVTEGKTTATISMAALNQTFIAYKFSDSYINLPFEDVYDQVDVVRSQFTPIGYQAIFYNEDYNYMHFFDMDNFSSGGILSASKDTFVLKSPWISEVQFPITLPSPGLYIFMPEGTTIEDQYDVIASDKIKQLDAKYSPRTNLSIVSTDYEALMNGETRIENPEYHVNLGEEEICSLVKKQKLEDIKFYYTDSIEDTNGHILSIKEAIPENGARYVTLYTNVVEETGKYAEIYIDDDSTVRVTWLAYISNDLNIENGTGENSLQMKNYCTASGIDSFATGHLTIASGNYSHAEGRVSFDTILLSGDANATTYSIGDYSINKFKTSNFISLASTPSKKVKIIEVGTNTFTVSETLSNSAFSSKTVNLYHSCGASGHSSHSEGNDTTASEVASHAEGGSTTASGRSSHAEGNRTTASGDHSHAEGSYTEASGDTSHAEGQLTTASGGTSHAEGYNTTARGYCSHSEGGHTIANGDYSHAGGYMSRAMGSTSFARGYEIEINRAYSTSIGKYNLDPDSTENTLETYLNTRIGMYKAQSYQTTYIEPVISLEDGTVIAESTTYLTPESFLPDMYVISPHVNDPGYWKILSTPELDDNYYYANVDYYRIKLSREQLSTYAFSVGNGTATNVRSNAHTLNWDGTAWYAGDVYVGGTRQSDAAAKKLATEEYVATTVTNQIARKADKSEVATNIVNGSKLGSVRTIETNETIGHFAFSEGQHTTASGQGSHAEGFGSDIIANYTISGEANTTTYTYNGSDPEIGSVISLNNIFTKIISIDNTNKTFSVSKTLSAENLTDSEVMVHEGIAFEIYSHAEGCRTTASGEDSHAEGYCTIASGDESHAEGYFTTASGQYQHVQGKANIIDNTANYAHIVGNGEPGMPSNAHTLDWNGNAWYQGNVYVGGTSQNDAAAKPLIAAPTTASIGQTIVVKAVDENGKPTEWECADIVTEAKVNELIAAALALIPNAEEATF